MTSRTIEQLAWFLPRKKYPGQESCVDTSMLKRNVIDDQLHYLECYKDLKFGWNAAAALTKDDAEFPAILSGKDLYVWRAYAFMHGASDSAVELALRFTYPAMESMRIQLEAMLCSTEITCDEVAHELAIPVDVVEAYERLFFNIIDRRNDHKFIATVLYPGTRLVEAYDDYLDNVGLADLMKRAGYNNGPADVLFCAGIRSNPFSMLTAQEGSSRIESLMMANGLMLMRAGWASQSRNATGVMHARQIMQAAKQGGVDTNDSAGYLTMGETLTNEIANVHRMAHTIDVDSYEIPTTV
ncbi:MAG: hypothetical protein RR382_01000 [Tannerellaceae bacterium]